jgi:ribosomal protein L22
MIIAQKVLAMSGLFEFCFKELNEDENGRKVYALDRSLLTNRNLFIRGPQGSGRGLLSASIKMHSAARDISTTPLPAEFSALRGMLHEYESYGSDTDITRSLVHGSYVDVQLMILEDIHCETKTMGKQNVVVRSRYANTFDSLLSKRAQQTGAMVFTSSQFAGEINDSLGEKLREVLDSESTYMILMVSPVEADALLRTLRARKKTFATQLLKFTSEKSNNKITQKERKAMSEGMEENVGVEFVKEGFYFEEAFPKIPGETDKLHEILKIFPPSAEVNKKYEEFMSEKEQSPRGIAYYKGLNSAIVNAVRSCTELSEKMTHREMKLIGQMMSVATQESGVLDDKVKYATKLRSWMAGKGDKP